MTVFAVVYFGTALAVTAAVYFMSLNSEKKPALKTVLLIVYILALVGLVFATGCLEAKYGFTRLKSTAIAVLILHDLSCRHIRQQKGKEERMKVLFRGYVFCSFIKTTGKAAPCLYFPINSRHSNPFDCEMYGTV